MNTETGKIYHGEAEIEAARQRGEPLIELHQGIWNDLNGRSNGAVTRSRPRFNREEARKRFLQKAQ